MKINNKYRESMSEDKVYTWEEVGAHNTDKDMWIVVGDEVFNMTDYSA